MTTEKPACSIDSRLNVTQASKILGVTRATIYNYIRSGKLLARRRKANGALFISGKDILKVWNEV